MAVLSRGPVEVDLVGVANDPFGFTVQFTTQLSPGMCSTPSPTPRST